MGSSNKETKEAECSLCCLAISGEKGQSLEEEARQAHHGCLPSAREVDDWIVVDSSTKAFKYKHRDDETKEKRDKARSGGQRNQSGSQNFDRRHLQYVMFGET